MVSRIHLTASEVSQALGGRPGSGGDYRLPHLCAGETRLGQNPGLSVRDGQAGALLVHCHYGCDQADAYAAVVSALGRSAPQERRVYGDAVVLSLTDCPACGAPGFHPRKPAWAQSYAPYLLLTCPAGCSYDAVHKSCSDLVAGRTGSAWLQRAPYLLADGFTRYRFRRDPSPGRKGSWEAEGKGRRASGLKPLLWLDDGGPAVLCEGDKAASALSSCLSGYSVYSAGDTSALKNADYSGLAGRDIILWPDNDKSGVSAMERAAQRLAALDCSLSLVDASGLPQGGDAADLPPQEVLSLLSGAVPYEPDVPRDGASPPAEDPHLTDTTHVADAWRLLARHGPRILLSTPADYPDRHGIFVLDEDTGIWRGGPEPLEFIHSDTAKAFAAETGVATSTGAVSSAVSKARLSWSKQGQGARGAAEAGKMLITAAHEMRRAGIATGVTIVPESRLDPPGRYLGVANGVLDLDKGSLLPPADAARFLITQASTTMFKPGATHPLVDQLASHLPGDDREYLLDSFAYGLRGRPDRRLNVLAGPPNGGKTTVREAVWCAVGDSLAFALPQNALLQERYPNRNTHDAGLTHLLTHRFAVGSEIPGGSTPIDAGRLKTISGGDSMALREPNEKHGRNRPASATVFLCLNTHNEGCNDLDRLPLHDSAVRDRVKIVLMPEVPGERDPSVLKSLQSYEFGEAMLAELVRRCASLAHPPEPPQSVEDAVTEQYARVLGTVGEWAVTHLRVTNRQSDYAVAADIHEALSDFMAENDEVPFESASLSVAAIREFVPLPKSVQRRAGEGSARVRLYPGVVLIP